MLAHELTHLKRRHPALLQLIFIVVAGSGDLYAMAGHVRGLPRGTILPICVALGLGIVLLVARRFARAADAAAVELTNDPEALVSALAKLNALNRMPLQWRKFQDTLIMYPSFLRCAQGIARSAAIPEDRLIRIFSSHEIPSDRYAVPAS